MKFEIKDIFKRKEIKILGVAAIANLSIMSYITKQWDIIGIISYGIIAMALAYVLKKKKTKLEYYAILGFLAPLFFNFIFSLLGFFVLDLMISLKAGIQQAVVTLIVAKLWGEK